MLKEGVAATSRTARSGAYELTGGSTSGVTWLMREVGSSCTPGVRLTACTNCTAPDQRAVCDKTEIDCWSKKRMISSENGPDTSGRIESVKQYMASA